MNLFDEQGINYGGGARGFRVYDELGHLVGASTGSGPPGPPGTNGTDGISLDWLGTFAVAPGSPTLLQAYRNSVDKKAYVWTGSSWQIMVEDGVDGTDGVSVNFLGTFASAPPSPTLNQAYRNSVLKKSFVWDGFSWQEFAEDGAVGATGATGATGPAGVLNWRGSLSTAPGSPAVNDAYHDTTLHQSFVWTGSAWSLFVEDGSAGATGATGATGAAGPGVPTGGTANQVLAKIDATNYNTQWVNPSSTTDVLKVQVFS